ncbi:DNA-3-methyladenine glycosylase I [Ralstonia solanacearum]|uniref:DNA-3-methyladenine glycosylase I n=1 Tax=Ralstonia solanacearum (strain Po82) TaxID=1031711 RepID=F6GAC5_RALS8|nr:DNA-3-methyladenine glycosylase I [Ralstonia solanacearum]AEG71640.1 DNA-3-methyladenine glycosylase I protein [Ralstonia solanacearum Po82]AMP71560.1 DNA-3-methyladenine glycosylase [Ralstonia solanacearum]AMP76514.1 DNA-3-methyladenine glycosylase [Ralstonia solanacearum]AYB62970.1 DNA-3-methyladenine glycosylase I [Ralstonia solanacearum]MBB6588663.1 DNA-3-methyladenine glycosylase I [Ralstonia solanacearum]
MSRCCWVGEDPLMIVYHDTEWGTPSHDDRHLYEMLVLEGAQAGLSWQTILRKRARYQEVFDGFDPARVARFTPARIEKLLADPGIVRNRAKVEAAVINARKVLEVQDEAGSLDGFLWAFVGGRPIVNRWNSYRDAPASSDASKAMSKALAARGFKFVGPTICYAFMQATGMVDDHEAGCFRAGKAKAGPK